MDAFSTAYMIAVGLIVLTVWALIIADAIGHYADRWAPRVKARAWRLLYSLGDLIGLRGNDGLTRKERRAYAEEYRRHVYRPLTPEMRDALKRHRTTDPRTDHS